MKWSKDGDHGYVSDNGRFAIMNVQRSVDIKKKWTLFDLADTTDKGHSREYYTFTLKEAKDQAERIEKQKPTSRSSLSRDVIGYTMQLPPAILGSKTETWLTSNAIMNGNEAELIEGWVRFTDDVHDSMQYLVYAEEVTDDMELPSIENIVEFRRAVTNRIIGADETIKYI